MTGDSATTLSLVGLFILGASDMSDYRIYCLDGDGHVARADWVDAKSDDEAIVLVRRKLGKAPFEIWERDRLVARVAPGTPDGVAVVKPKGTPSARVSS